jgi:hypothetical protein
MAPRLTTAAMAFLGAAAIAAISTAAATDSTCIAATIAGHNGWMIPGLLSAAGLACLILALGFASPHPIIPALAVFGAAWLVAIPGSGGLRPLTAVAGGWLLAVGELAYWSLDLELAGKNHRAVYIRRGATIAALVGASMALAIVPELSLSPTSATGVELTALGLLAAAAMVAVAAVLAWRLRPPADAPRGRGPAELG